MITRRTALKALGSMMLAPIVKLRQEIDREALLSAFCVPEQMSRYDLTKPWGEGSLTYASDARYICRAEIANRVEIGERRVPREMDKLWAHHWKPLSIFRDLEVPTLDVAKLLPVERDEMGICPQCGGTRRVSYGPEYPPESKRRYLERVCGYDIDDNSIYDPSCTMCRGKEWNGKPWLLDVCGVPMAYHRLAPLIALPEAKVAASDGCILVKADGFEAISMGVSG